MKDPSLHRRHFLHELSLGTLGLGFGGSLFGGIFRCAEAAIADGKHDLFTKGRLDFKGFMAKEITPNDDFYITSYSKKVPRIAADRFRLRVEGMVEHPYEFTLKELEAMQDKGEYVTLECIGNPIGGDAISNAYWEGVTLSKVLHRAVPKPGVVKTAFFAEDGYSDSIPYDLSRSEDVFLAWRMNGQPLPPVHGYPLRVIVPGIFGMKNVKWLSRIELLTHDFKGYWEKQGWSDEAVIPIHSQVLMPMKGEMIPLGHYVIGGIAYAGRHGIGRVQVSVDDERTWQDAELKPPLSKWAWVLWRYDWKPVAEGDATIRVRSVDKAGKAQESGSLLGRVTGSFPNGAKGIHGVRVVVRKV